MKITKKLAIKTSLLSVLVLGAGTIAVTQFQVGASQDDIPISVDAITTNTRAAVGSAPSGTKIKLTDAEGHTLGEGVAFDEGAYAVSFKTALHEGDIVKVDATLGDKKAVRSVKVGDNKKVPALSIMTPKANDTKITGLTEPHAKLVMSTQEKNGSVVIGYGTADDDGLYVIDTHGRKIQKDVTYSITTTTKDSSFTQVTTGDGDLDITQDAYMRLKDTLNDPSLNSDKMNELRAKFNKIPMPLLYDAHKGILPLIKDYPTNITSQNGAAATLMSSVMSSPLVRQTAEASFYGPVLNANVIDHAKGGQDGKVSEASQKLVAKYYSLFTTKTKFDNDKLSKDKDLQFIAQFNNVLTPLPNEVLVEYIDPLVDDVAKKDSKSLKDLIGDFGSVFDKYHVDTATQKTMLDNADAILPHGDDINLGKTYDAYKSALSDNKVTKSVVDDYYKAFVAHAQSVNPISEETQDK